MRRIDTATKKEIQDKSGKSFDGFVEGNPEAGVEPTHLSDSWCNNLQEEICNVIEGVGHKINDETTPSGNNEEVRVEKYDQMFQAIKLLVDAVTPIGSVKAMSVKMTENIAKWVPIDEDEDDDDASIIGTEGTAYLSKQMAKNCEQVDGDKAGWYKLISINKENGDPSGVSGWALADGTFPLPLKPFGEDEGPPAPEKRTFWHATIDDPITKDNEGELISDTEYGKIWAYKKESKYNKGKFFGDNSALDLHTDDELNEIGGGSTGYLFLKGHFSDSFDTFGRSYASWYDFWRQSNYILKDEDLLPPKDDTPIDLRMWTKNNTKKPKLIPNLNDRTFLMGSNEENLPLTVEGKNGFIMKPYHMPPHSHRDSPHVHYMSTSGSDGFYEEGKYHYLKTSALTNVAQEGLPTSSFFKTIDQSASNPNTVMTGGYYIYSTTHKEGGDMQQKWRDLDIDPTNKHLWGTVPIDLRPKRLQVYYYIRVI